MLYCQNCVTPIATGTGIPGTPVSTFMVPLTQTAQALVTPSSTPTASPTVTPTQSACVPITCGNILNGSGTCTQLDTCTIRANIEWSTSYRPYSSGSITALPVSGIFTSGQPMYIRYDEYTLQIANNYSASKAIDYWYSIFPGFNHTQGLDDYFVSAFSTAFVQVPRLDYIFYTGGQQQNGLTASIYANRWATTSVNFTLSAVDMPIYISSLPFPSGTPTPSPIPTSLSYCSTVLPDSGGDDISGEFQLPVPMLGAIHCPVNFPGLTIPLYNVLNLPDFQIPHVKICFQEVTFGSLRYFGVDIELDYIAYVLAVALVISMFVRK
jgi:hypothetical protein